MKKLKQFAVGNISLCKYTEFLNSWQLEIFHSIKTRKNTRWNYSLGYNLIFFLREKQELEVGKYSAEAKQREHNPACSKGKYPPAKVNRIEFGKSSVHSTNREMYHLKNYLGTDCYSGPPNHDTSTKLLKHNHPN
jgi:hypothetical protein